MIKVDVGGSGRWERKFRGRYDVSLDTQTAPAEVKKNHRVYIGFNGMALVFGRVY